MAHKLFLVVLCVLSTLVYATATESATNKADGAIKFEVGGKADNKNIKSLFTNMNKSPDDSESGDGSGIDDTEIYSGSGSGEPVEEVKTTLPPKRSTKTKTKSESTVMVIKEVTDKPTSKKTTKKTTESNDIPTGEDPTEDPLNTVGASTGEKEEKTGVDFTVGIIVGVVVGAILAILVIVFLVYRLRKKDEGSYSLDEQSSQAFIRDEKNGGGQGKEYFA